MKKLFTIFILFAFCFINSTCKKASAYSINMCGEWISLSSCQMGIIIKKDNSGSYRSYNSKSDCGIKDWNGKFYITNTQLRLEKIAPFGSITFRFIEKPSLNQNNDSITSQLLSGDASTLKTRRVIATMVLKSQDTYNDAKLKYYKIIDY